MRRLLNVEDVSHILNRSTSWVYQNYKKKHKKDKFPLPLQDSYSLLWDSQAVDIWLNLHLPSEFKTNDNLANSFSFEAALAANACNL